MARASFPPEARLHNAGEFRAVFANGRRHARPGFVLVVASNGRAQSRLGLALAKRHIKRAVDRNRVKRVLRESFRNARLELGGVDVVVLARSRTAEMSNDDLFVQLAQAWQRVARRPGSQHDAG